MDDDATITPYSDGPYIVRGNFRITDQNGNAIETGRRRSRCVTAGARRSGPSATARTS
jgi:hypothetical protein